MYKFLLMFFFSFCTHILAKEIPVYLAYEFKVGNKVIGIADNNENGRFDDSGERYLYFGKGNASNVGYFTEASEVKSAFTDIMVSQNNAVFLSDMASGAVYRGKDKNNDGDIQDKAEVSVWFSSENAAGYSSRLIMAVAQGPDGAIYLLKAGIRDDPNDVVYRTMDLNHDGDANDKGEASIYLADSELPVLTFGSTVIPHAFAGLDMSFYKGDLYILESGVGVGESQLYRAHDSDGSNTITAGEISLYFKASTVFPRNPEQVLPKIAADENGLYIVHGAFDYYDKSADGGKGAWVEFAPEKRRMLRIVDADNDGSVSASEAITLWDARQLPVGKSFYHGWGIAADNGRYMLSSIDDVSTTPTYEKSNIWLLKDSKTTLLLESGDDFGIKNPRGLAFSYKTIPDPAPIGNIIQLIMIVALIIAVVVSYWRLSKKMITI